MPEEKGDRLRIHPLTGISESFFTRQIIRKLNVAVQGRHIKIQRMGTRMTPLDGFTFMLAVVLLNKQYP